jgi:hypothetical protein
MPLRPAFIAHPAAVLASLAAALAFAQAAPPVAPVKPVTDTYFGVTVVDPYRYMENMKDPEVAGWTKAQADYTHAVLSKIPGRATLYKEIETRGDAASARVYDVQIVGTKVYYQKRRADENIGKLYVRDGFDGVERLLVDPDTVKSADGKHSAIDWFVPSPDNKYLGYGMSPGGSEESVLHIIEVASGKPTGDVIDRANFGNPSWLDASRFVYNRLQKLPEGAPATDKYQNSRVYVHKMGDDPEKDSTLIGVGVSPAVKLEPADITIVYKPSGSDYMIVQAFNGTQRELRLWAAPVASLNGDKTPWVKIAGFEDEVTDVAISVDTVYVMTHKGTPRFKVLRTSLAKPDLAQAETVVPRSEAVVTGIGAAKDALYVRKMNGGNSELYRLQYTPGAKPQQIALPFVGDIAGLAVDPRVPGAVVNLGGWVRFGGYYAYDPRTGKLTDTRLQPQGKYDNPTNLVATEVKGKGARRHDDPDVDRAQEGHQARRHEPDAALWLRRVRNSTVAIFPSDMAAVVRSRRRARGRARARRRRVRRGLVQGRLQGNQAQHLARCDRVRRVAGRQQVHVVRKAVDHGRQRRRHLRRPLDHRASRSLRRGDRRRASFRCASLRIHGQWHTEYSGVRHRYDRGRLQGAPCDESICMGQGRRQISGGASDDGFQRPARRRVASGQAGGTTAGGNVQRQADSATHRLRRGPRASGRRRNRSTKSAPTLSPSCCGRRVSRDSSPDAGDMGHAAHVASWLYP